MLRTPKEIIQALVADSDIIINGTRSWDIRVHNDTFFERVISGGSLGLGESYMDGWWDVEHLDEFFSKILRSGLEKRARRSPQMALYYLRGKIFNVQKSRAFHIGEHHYDIGNDLYAAMLDKRMAYTCGYWNGNPPAGGLDEAQEAKLDLVCRKLNLKRGQRVLDIGSGWGSFIKFAAERYGAHCIGVTVSKEQAEYANATRSNLPIETRLQDYRDVNEKFDHIVSLGMFEHVGYKNYKTYMKKVSSMLTDDGLFLLHTIGGNKSVAGFDPWIEKYIFPNSMLPSVRQIAGAAEDFFVMEDWHNFGMDYDATLMHWYKNFNAHWPAFQQKYGDRFYRMWKYYFLVSAGSFRSRKNQLWQIVFSKKGARGGYQSIR